MLHAHLRAQESYSDGVYRTGTSRINIVKYYVLEKITIKQAGGSPTRGREAPLIHRERAGRILFHLNRTFNHSYHTPTIAGTSRSRRQRKKAS